MADVDSTPRSGPRLGMALAVFVIALGLRCMHLFELHDADWFGLYIGDGEVYREWALGIAGGDWLGDRVFYQAPLYPYFLGVIYALGGDSPLVVRLVQIIIGAGACVLLALCAARLGDRRAGWAARVLPACYPQAIYFDALFQKSMLDFFCFALVLYAIARALHEERAWWWGAAGGALALFMLTRENAAALAAVVLVWLGWRAWRVGGARRWGAAGAVAGGLTAVLLPVALRNYAVGGEFHLTSSQLGPNLYIGNNPDASGSYMSLRPSRGHADYERIDATELAAAGLGIAAPTPRQVSRYWVGKTFDYVRAQPAHWLALMGRKAHLLVHAVERADTESIYAVRQYGRLLWAMSHVFTFGVLLALAGGAVWVLGTGRGWAVVYALAAVYGLSVIAFFVFDRYRHPLAAPLLLMAGCGLAGAARWWRTASAGRRGGAVAVMAVLLAVTHWPSGTAVAEQRATAELAYANELYRQRGDAAGAIPHVRASLSARPSAAAYSKLGVLLAVEGDATAGEAMLRKALTLNPRFGEALRALGVACVNTGRIDEALTHLHAAVDVYEQDFVALYHLGVAYDRKLDANRAIDHYVRALLAADQPAKVEVCLDTLRRHPFGRLAIPRLRAWAADAVGDDAARLAA